MEPGIPGCCAACGGRTGAEWGGGRSATRAPIAHLQLWGVLGHSPLRTQVRTARLGPSIWLTDDGLLHLSRHYGSGVSSLK